MNQEYALSSPKLYSDLASWFHLLTAPEDYGDEAEYYTRLIVEACEALPRTLLELGSGGGNSASHLKAHFDMTLVDLSPQMLEVSRSLNPECEHIVGDMRTVRLGREFDAVFVHDAADGRALRYLEWTSDTDPNDTSYAVDFAILLREPGGSMRFEHDRHVFGVFPRETWLRLLREAGFQPELVTSNDPETAGEVFVGMKPRG